MIPSDCTLVPAQRGALLVSPSYGLYCAILPDEIAIIDRCLKQQTEDLSQVLSPDLYHRLEDHGFFGDPRPFDSDPPLLQFQVTNACNLRCIYCAVNSGIARPNEISLDDVKRTIDEAVAIYPDLRISFTGGEPLIVPWIFDAIDYAAQHSKHIGLLSNLLLIKDNPRLFQKIVDFVHAGHQLRMSISAMDREVCDRLSGRVCYDDALEIIRRLDQADALPHVDIPLSAPDSQANVKAYPELRRHTPINRKLLFAKMYIGGRETGEHVFKSSDDEEKMLDDLVFEGGTCIETEKCSPITYRKTGCSCADTVHLCVQSDGTVFSCFRLMGKIGHISEGIQTIIDRRHKTPRQIDLEPCKSCPFKYLCGCGCQTDRLLHQNDFLHETVCPPWRKKLVTEMLFEDKPYFYDWPFLYLMAEAHKRRLDVN